MDLSEAPPGADLRALSRRAAAVRARTLALAGPLSEADCQVQAMPDASPTKWHLAHTTWFFETFVLERYESGFQPFHPAFRVLFNSYYNGVGEQHPRAQRGLVTRPDLATVKAYRHAVDERLFALLDAAPPPLAQPLAERVELGLQHEQQHQELILTDLLYLLSCNPLDPVYHEAVPAQTMAAVAQGWVGFAGGLVEIGHRGVGFAFDNESPRHRAWLEPYELARRLVTQGEWAGFVADGGYRDPRWWLSAGWDWVRSQRAEAPLYWRREGGRDADWSTFTLHGRSGLRHESPVVHLSWFEADAFTRWWSAQHPGQAPARLPTETEWEHAAEAVEPGARAAGNFTDSGALCPLPARAAHDGPLQLFGDAWEWTASSYAPYPGFRSWDGAVGEYNAKFMADQYVLRGGSCATPADHIRASYRNFFPSSARWQFSGLRLARDLSR